MSGVPRSAKVAPLTSSPPFGQPLYTYLDAYSAKPPSPAVDHVLPQSYKIPLEITDLSVKRTNKTDGALSSYSEKTPRSVVVVVDASKELRLDALQFSLQDIVMPGDHLYLVGIFHEVLNPLGFKQKADIVSFGGINKKRLIQEVKKKLVEFKYAIDDQEIQKLFVSKQVTPVITIAAGPVRSKVTAAQVKMLKPAWVILDGNLRKDKNYLKDRLHCNMVFMSRDNAPWPVGPKYVKSKAARQILQYDDRRLKSTIKAAAGPADFTMMCD